VGASSTCTMYYTACAAGGRSRPNSKLSIACSRVPVYEDERTPPGGGVGMCSDFGVASLIRAAAVRPRTIYRIHARTPALQTCTQTNLLRGIATREPMRLATQSVIVPMRMHGGPREKILPGIGVGWHSMQRTLHRFISGGWGRLHARALALPVLSSASCGPTVTCHVRGLGGGGTRTLCCPRAAEPPADL
jgi:hypothetical protein